MDEKEYFRKCVKCKDSPAKTKKKIKICYVTVVIFGFILGTNSAEAQTRDPKFYSREGDRSWPWPNPGDPDYR